jgi:hypothetical protein
VCPVSPRFGIALHPAKHIVILKRSQQLVMAGAGLVRAGHDRIDAAQRREGADALRRLPAARPDGSVGAGRVFQRSHDRCPDGDDPAAAALAGGDRRRR